MQCESVDREERLSYWFPAAYSESLANIFQYILLYPEGAIRTFFLCGFSNILKRCSTWLSGSTKSQKDLDKVLADPVEEFRQQIHHMLKHNSLYWHDIVQRGISPAELTERCHIQQDMCASLHELVRVTAPNKRLVLIIGNSTRRGLTIPTSEALCEMALNSGFELERKIVRQIPQRRLISTRNQKTGRFSSTIQSDMQVYPEEHVLVLRRLG